MSPVKNITVIPATRDIFTGIPIRHAAKRRVAAYARVSTDSEEQQSSYTAQVDYYTAIIKGNPEWEFAGIYTDEGISGTMMKNRNGFNQMIEDALSGKIDLIITKSVSRFARNTVDSLTTIRKLKEKGVEVYFEKENIYSLDSKGELLLTLMSSLAQEESRSLSQNVTWGQRKRFSDGKVSMPYKNFLGYRKGADGLPEIVPEEAKIIRRIYREFIHGASLHSIAKGLTADGIKTPRGKDTWSKSTVESILCNEKYKGDALLQKSFTTDYLTKKKKINEGEVPQYYVTGSHPAIISPKEWDTVQLEMQRRKESGNYSSSVFAGKIKCGDCGRSYGSKVWHSTDKYRRVIWQCNNKFNGTKCTTPHVNEESIKRMFLEAFSRICEDRTSIIRNLEFLLSTVYNTSDMESEINTLEQEMEKKAEELKCCIKGNATASITEDDYRNMYDTLYSSYQELQNTHDRLVEKVNRATAESSAVNDVITTLKSARILPAEFDTFLWRTMVDEVTVHNDGKVLFKMATGDMIEFEIKDYLFPDLKS